jgi:fucose permease
MEAIVNNWTTTYLTRQLSVEESTALYSLSLYVGGMTGMRLLIGGALRSVSPSKLMAFSIAVILFGIIALYFGRSTVYAIGGLILLGIGLAAGFPIMLGLAGERFASQSGTAFSFIFTISLIGNMLVNYLMGWISKSYGIRHYISLAFVELLGMLVMCVLIFKKQIKKQRTYAGETMAD